jgi:hypothetical protein
MTAQYMSGRPEQWSEPDPPPSWDCSSETIPGRAKRSWSSYGEHHVRLTTARRRAQKDRSSYYTVNRRSTPGISSSLSSPASFQSSPVGSSPPFLQRLSHAAECPHDGIHSLPRDDKLSYKHVGSLEKMGFEPIVPGGLFPL